MLESDSTDIASAMHSAEAQQHDCGGKRCELAAQIHASVVSCSSQFLGLTFFEDDNARIHSQNVCRYTRSEVMHVCMSLSSEQLPSLKRFLKAGW